MANLKQRVLSGVLANGTGQVLTVGIQFASLPILLHYWSVEVYGQWLLLSAVPGYFSLADIGVGAVAMNRMTMLTAQGQQHRSNAVFQTAILTSVVASTVLMLAATVVVYSLDPVRQVAARASTTLVLLIATALLGMLAGLIDGVFRASGRFAAGVQLINAGRLAEWVGGMAGLLVAGTMLSVATGMLFARVAVTVAYVFYARHSVPQFIWGVALASRREFDLLVAPAIGFLALPLGLGISLQGMNLLIGGMYGPVALAIFNTARTVSRVPVQLISMFTRSLWPEMSRCFGIGDSASLRRLYVHGRVVAVAGSAVMCLALFAGGSLLINLWTHGKIPYDGWLLLLLLIASFTSCFWQVDQVLLAATNQHLQLSLWFLAASVAAVMGSALLPAAAGLRVLAAVLVTLEAVMIVVSRQLVKRRFSS